MSSAVRTAPYIRVMLVDDSVTVRGLLRRIIEKDPAFEIVASAGDGLDGLEKYKQHKPDIMLMDVEMPQMDGLTALKEILAFDPSARVIMCSSLTQKGAETTFQALEIGALDCLAKPSSDKIDRGQSFEEEVVHKLKSLSRAKPLAAASNPIQPPAKPDDTEAPISLQPFPENLPNRFPLAIAIGSSTGGPNALIEVLSAVNKNLMLPIFITQHIPANFSAHMAMNIEKRTGLPSHEGVEGMVIQPGHVYVAPGGKHMGISKDSPKKIILLDTPPVNFCKPAIDVMFNEMQQVYGGNLLVVLLTGMGSDGKEGCKNMAQAAKNNIFIAQDKATSVVWGIPGAVVKEGLCHAVLPLAEIGPAINKLVKRQPI